MIRIEWDNSLPPTKTLTEIERWDEWFKLVGLYGEWKSIKEYYLNDEKKQLMWASIMELNRISAEMEKNQCQEQ